MSDLKSSPTKLYTLEQLISWLESFEQVGEKDGWKFMLPDQGMTEQLIMILRDYTGSL